MIHTIIIVNGLGGEMVPLKWATRHWYKNGFEFIYHHVDWKKKPADIQTNLDGILKIIDSLAAAGHKISLIGCSAGAGFVLNAFAERKEIISHIINICGPVRKEPLRDFRSLEWWKNISPLLIQSVERIEEGQGTFSEIDRKKIMTIQAGLGDELVPPELITIPGAYNIKVPCAEHTLSIYASLTLFSKKLISFLNDERK